MEGQVCLSERPLQRPTRGNASCRWLAHTLIFMRHFGRNYYHYLTENSYQRARIFDFDRFKRKFVQTLDDLRTELGLKIVGHVLRPEHFHLLIRPEPAESTPLMMKELIEGK